MWQVRVNVEHNPKTTTFSTPQQSTTMAPKYPCWSLLSPSPLPVSPNTHPTFCYSALMAIDVSASLYTAAPCKSQRPVFDLQSAVRNLAASFVQAASAVWQTECRAYLHISTGTSYARDTPYRVVTNHDERNIDALEAPIEFTMRGAQAEVNAVKRIASARTTIKASKVLPATVQEDVKTWRQMDAALLHVVNKQLGRTAPSVKVLPNVAMSQELGSRSKAAVARHIMRIKNARR